MSLTYLRCKMTKLEKKLLENAHLIVPNLQGRCRHVSFVVVRNKIISIGTNSYIKTSPLSQKFGARDGFIHSELAAIVNAPRSVDLSKTTVYNVRISLTGEIKLSAPCPSCQKVLVAFDIRRCYFTTEEGIFERFF